MNKTYKLGEVGPAGGLIFYINPNAVKDGWKYLEAAPESTEWTDTKLGVYVGGDAQLTGIGNGKAATDAIVSHMEGMGITETPEQLCDGLSHSGFDDWFLPFKDELNAIWDNLVDDGSGSNSGVGEFATEFYWSSSEGTGFSAWFQSFSDGSQDLNGKCNHSRVRAVRAF